MTAPPGNFTVVVPNPGEPSAGAYHQTLGSHNEDFHRPHRTLVKFSQGGGGGREITFMMQNTCQTLIKAIKLPLERPTTSRTALFNVGKSKRENMDPGLDRAKPWNSQLGRNT